MRPTKVENDRIGTAGTRNLAGVVLAGDVQPFVVPSLALV
ncbi:MAG: hypothetical protein AVDCRST_MAG77-4223 [uncultured Chloroflexi bacterium]|uniref:Uncharacterized protein n=1 Tax=uncultured Chloroflexota bacterium TaxID=166587 RepID=A0A6J4JRY1_9CHLR|nr:MAG: hypothetical protein AVDCRST_MAG77-4223 [uncultured Chloroflexota bacterium]